MNSHCWNAQIIPFNTSKKIAFKQLVNRLGEEISINSGLVLLKSLIVKFKANFEQPAILTSNLLTIFDLEDNKVIVDYTPLQIISLKGRINQVSVIDFGQSIPFSISQIEEIEFRLLDLNKRLLDNIEYSVHIWFKIC